MKKYTSMNDVNFRDVLYILNEWEIGRLNDEKVFNYAEDIYYLNALGWPVFSEDEPRSILFGVLEALLLLYTQPTLKEDIPELKKALRLGENDPKTAWGGLHNYWESINWQDRLE